MTDDLLINDMSFLSIEKEYNECNVESNEECIEGTTNQSLDQEKEENGVSCTKYDN